VLSADNIYSATPIVIPDQSILRDEFRATWMIVGGGNDSWECGRNGHRITRLNRAFPSRGSFHIHQAALVQQFLPDVVLRLRTVGVQGEVDRVVL